MASLGLLILFPFLMAYAASSDLLTMLIPNWISLALIVGFGITAGASGMGWTEIGLHLGAGALTLVATFTLFALGIIGGGDAKLTATTAVWVGFGQLADYLLVASVLGGCLTLGLLAARAQPLPFGIVRFPFAVHLHDRKTGVPYGIALAAAGLIVLPWTALWAQVIGA